MEIAKVALHLSGRDVENLVFFIREIIGAMTGNANFTTPNPTLAALGTAADELELAEQQKKQVGIVNRNAKKTVAITLLKQEALYVQLTANGNPVIIESSGMPLQKTRTPQGLPGQVGGLKIQDGSNQGEALTSHKGAAGIGNEYFTQYSNDPTLADKSWVAKDPTGKLRLLIKDLVSGRRVAFRVRAKNTAGFGPWSTVAFRTIQ